MSKKSKRRFISLFAAALSFGGVATNATNQFQIDQVKQSEDLVPLRSKKGFNENELIERNSFEFDRFTDKKQVASVSDKKIRMINEFNDRLARISEGTKEVVRSINNIYYSPLGWLDKWSSSTVNQANKELQGICASNFGKIESFLKEANAYIEKMENEYPTLIDGFSDKSSCNLILDRIKLIKSVCFNIGRNSDQCLNRVPNSGKFGTDALDMWEEILSYLRNEVKSSCEVLDNYASKLSGDLDRLKSVSENLSDDYEVWKKQAAIAAARQLEDDKARFVEDKKELMERLNSVINGMKSKIAELDNEKLSLEDKAINSVMSSEFGAQYDTSISRLKAELLALEKLDSFSVDNKRKMDSISSVLAKEIASINEVEINMEGRKDALLNNLRDILKQKKELINYLNDMKQGLNYEWESALIALKPADQEKLKALIESNINDANGLINDEIKRCSDMVISIKNDDTKVGLQRIWNKVKNNMAKDIESIRKNVSRKRTVINVSAMRRDIEEEMRNRDALWDAYVKKFSPDETEDLAKVEATKIWPKANLKYEREVKWANDNLPALLESEENDEAAEAKLKETLDIVRERVEIFAHELDACAEPIEKAIDDMYVEKMRKWAWEKIFNSDGAIPMLKKEVGESQKNASEQDSEKIAQVIDSFLPGNYAVAKDLAMKLRSKGCAVSMITGAPGFGKTQTVNFLANATNSRLIDVDYNEIASMGGQQFAEQRIIKGAGKQADDPVTMVVMDEVDDIARKREGGKRGENTAKVLKVIDALKKAAEDGYKIKIYCISNLDKRDLDSAFASRISSNYEIGKNPNYKHMLEVICAGIQVAAEDRSKEDFLNEISRACDKLKAKGTAPSGRNLVMAVRECQDDAVNKLAEKFEMMNRGKEDLLPAPTPWDVKLRASDVVLKLQQNCSGDY